MPRDKLALSLAGILLCLAAAAKLSWYLWTRGETRFDDAYMYLRYASNLLNGAGIAWNAEGPQTYGATSLLYLFQIAGFLKVFSALKGAHVLMLASALNTAGACALLALAFKRAVTVSWLKNYWLLAGLTLLWFAEGEALSYYAWAGMDTSLSVMANALLVVLGARLFETPSARNAAAAGIAAYAVYLTRIDQALCAAGFPVLGVLLIARGDRGKALAVFCATFAALFACDAAVKTALFGSILPLPAHVKTAGFYKEFSGLHLNSAFHFFRYFIEAGVPGLVLIALGASRDRWKTAVVYLLPVIATDAVLLQGIPIMGNRGRFFLPGLPFIAACGVSLAFGGTAGAEIFSRGGVRRLLVRGAVVLALFQFLPPGLSFVESWTRQRGEGLSRGTYDEGLRDYLIRPYGPEHQSHVKARWQAIFLIDALMKKAGGGLVAAATEHGYLAAENPSVRIIDMNGLHDPVIARNGFSASYVLSQKPDLVWFPYWDYTGSIKSFWSEQPFWDEYEYYPRGFLYGIAVRKASPRYESVRAALEEAWRSMHPSLPMNAELVPSREALENKIAAERGEK